MPVRILIVEDHAIMLEGLRHLLGSKENVEIVGEAAEGDAALILLKEKKPDVVIMDLELPGEHGLVLTRRFKAIAPAMKIVVFTGHVDAKSAQDALDAGASGYLRKTNGAAELVRAIETVLTGQVYLCSTTTTTLVQSSLRVDAHPGTGAAIPEREMQVLQLVVRGLRNKEIAGELKIGIKTVETYRARVMKRTGCASPAELVRYAMREGLAKL